MIVLVTDSTAYISAAEAAALGVMVLPMTYSVDAQAPVNERYVDDNGDFERLIRENPTTLRTSQVSFVRFQSAFEELRAAGHQILCMTISSRLSGTYGNAFNAARELPGDGIRVVDSLSTGGGLTLLLREARRMIASGMNLADTAEAINAYLSRRRQNIQRCYTLFEAAGISREPTNGDIRMMEQWRTQGYEPEMLAIAAESAKGAGNPMVYIGRVVENWAAKGISTPEAARAEHEKWVEGIRQRAESPAQNADAPRQSAVSRPSKEVGAHRFSQRSYTDEQLDALLYTDLDELNS